MTVVLVSPHWASNARIQRAANNQPPIRKFDSDKLAVRLLQEALIRAGFPMQAGADGAFGQQTANAIIAAEKKFGFVPDEGVAGREVIGALDLVLRGWTPPDGAHWGGQLALLHLPLANSKVTKALRALTDVRTMLSFGKFDFVTADGVTMVALRTHFKLVPPGGTIGAIEEPIQTNTIDPLIRNFRGIQSTINNRSMIRHTICTGGDGVAGLFTAAEAPLGGPVSFGPPFSDFRLDPVNVTNIARTGKNSLAAMIMHEATHVIDAESGNDATSHISEFTEAYERQPARFARHNPSAYATFAAHIDDQADRPRLQRFGLGAGRAE